MIYTDNLTDVQLLGLTDSSTGLTVNDATVTAILSDLEENIITTITLTSTGNGNYSGQLTTDITNALTPHTQYFLEVVASVGDTDVYHSAQGQPVEWRAFNE